MHAWLGALKASCWKPLEMLGGRWRGRSARVRVGPQPLAASPRDAFTPGHWCERGGAPQDVNAGEYPCQPSIVFSF